MVVMGLLMMALVQVLIGLVVFQIYIKKTSQIVAPNNPNSRIGLADNVWKFLEAIQKLNEEASTINIDAKLALSLSRLRCKIASISFVIVGGPALFLYNLGSTSYGFLSLEDLASDSSDDSVQSRLWIVVWSGYLSCLAFFWLCRYEHKIASKIIRDALKKAPAHHYVILATNKGKTLEQSFPAAYSIQHIETISLSRTIEMEGKKEEQKFPPKSLPWFWSEGSSPLAPYISPIAAFGKWLQMRRDRFELGLQGALNEYVAWLRICAHRQERNKIGCRMACEVARQRVKNKLLNRENKVIGEYAFVSFDSLRAKRKAMKDECYVGPAAEPRDIVWERLERESHGFSCSSRLHNFLKPVCILIASALIAFLQLVGLIIIGKTNHPLALMMAGVMPATLHGIIISFIINILAFFEIYHPRACTKSEGEKILSFETSIISIIFFYMLPTVTAAITFVKFCGDINMVPMGKTSKIHSQQPIGNKLLEAALLQQLPAISSISSSSLLLLKSVELFVMRALRLPAYVSWRFALNRIKIFRNLSSVASFRRQRALRLQSERITFFVDSIWENFALSIGISMAAITPLASVLAAIYLHTSRYVRRYEYLCIKIPNYETNGLSIWPTGIFEIQFAIFAGICIHFLVLLFSGSLIHIIMLLPLFCLHGYFFFSFSSISSLSLNLSEEDEYLLDTIRPQEIIHRAHDFLASEQAWQNRMAPPSQHPRISALSTDFYPGDKITMNEHLSDIHDRLESLSAWINRYDSSTFVPTFFSSTHNLEYYDHNDSGDDLENENDVISSVPQQKKYEQHDVVYNAPTLVKIQDAVWRKMNAVAASSS